MPSDFGIIPFKGIRNGSPVFDRSTGLRSYNMSIDYSGGWIDLNDKLNYQVGAESMQQSQVSWRKVQAQSPVTEGSYTIHAVREMVTENIQIYVRGGSQWETQINLAKLEELFSRLDFRLKFNFDDYQEYWRCQTAEYSTQRSQVYTHNTMAVFTAQVPRFPTVTRERVL